MRVRIHRTDVVSVSLKPDDVVVVVVVVCRGWRCVPGGTGLAHLLAHAGAVHQPRLLTPAVRGSCRHPAVDAAGRQLSSGVHPPPRCRHP